MNPLIVFSCIVGCLLPFSAQADEVHSDSFRIDGRLSGVPDGAAIRLKKIKGSLLVTVQTDTVRNGRFHLADTLTGGAQNFCLTTDIKKAPNSWLDVWVAPGKHVTISGQGVCHPMWHVESDVPEQAYEARKLAAMLPEEQQFLFLLGEENECMMELYRHQNADKGRAARLRQQIDSLSALVDPLEKVRMSKLIDFLGVMPVSEPWLRDYTLLVKDLDGEEATTAARIRALYTCLPDSIRHTDRGRTLKAYIELPPPLRVGDDYVDGDLYDTQGGLHHLSEFEGRYLLLDFWSQGCGPCLRAIPELQTLQEQYADSLTVVSLSEDPKDLWQEYVSANALGGVQWNELRPDGTGLRGRYGVTGIPHFVLISPAGKLLESWSGYGKGVLNGKLAPHLRP